MIVCDTYNHTIIRFLVTRFHKLRNNQKRIRNMLGLKILANSYKNDCWNRSYAYNQKKTNSPRGEVCPKANVSYQ